MAKIVSIAVSRKKGVPKTTVPQVRLAANHGIEGDAHAGPWHRQVSFLSSESIERAKQEGLKVDFGDFAENFATEGIDWTQQPVGTRLKIGSQVAVEITQIGKECHNKCAIYYKAGDCIMPKEGIFAKVLQGGMVKIDDPIELILLDD